MNQGYICEAHTCQLEFVEECPTCAKKLCQRHSSYHSCNASYGASSCSSSASRPASEAIENRPYVLRGPAISSFFLPSRSRNVEPSDGRSQKKVVRYFTVSTKYGYSGIMNEFFIFLSRTFSTQRLKSGKMRMMTVIMSIRMEAIMRRTMRSLNEMIAMTTNRSKKSTTKLWTNFQLGAILLAKGS